MPRSPLERHWPLKTGDGTFPLRLNHARISVEGQRAGELLAATLQSPPTRSGAASVDLVGETLALFRLLAGELDDRIPPAIAHAGADHLVFALRDRARLAAVHYDLDAGRVLARRNSIGTFSLIYAEGPRRFHARNPFPIGGVYEDLPQGRPRQLSLVICATLAGPTVARSNLSKARTWACHPACWSN